MKQKILFLSLVSGVVIAIDQVVKGYIHAHYQLGESLSVWRGIFNITYVRNYGAAFGFLNNSHPQFREVFFLTTPPIALITILFILRNVLVSDRWQILALSSIFGGAVGNYIDRLRFRYVIDFLDFHWYESYTFPAFNVADMSIVGGVMLLVGLLIVEGRRISDSEENDDEAKSGASEGHSLSPDQSV